MFGKRLTMIDIPFKEDTPRHILRMVGGIFDGSFMPVYKDDICFVTCVLNYNTKIAHYYHLVSDKVVSESGQEFLQTYYQFWTSQEFTEENDKYIEDHSDEYKNIKALLDKKYDNQIGDN